MMTKGVVYVAFGNEYMKVAAASAMSVSEHCKLPVHVICNGDYTVYQWPENTIFERLDLLDESNRQIRVTMYDRTPFDRTLMLDADCLVASDKVSLPLDYLNRFDMCLVAYRPLSDYGESSQWQSARDILHCNSSYVMAGGVIYFKKNRRVKQFFSLWEQYWRENGCGRDMPALFRAVWDSNIRFWPLAAQAGWLGIRNGYILHEVGKTVKGLPDMEYKLRPSDNKETPWEKRPTRNHKPKQEIVHKCDARPSIRYVAEKFKDIKPLGLVGAEVGVWRGDHAQKIYDYLQPRKLYLVDPWHCYEVNGPYGQWMLETRGHEKWLQWQNRDWDSVYLSVRKRFEDYARISINRIQSHDGIQVVPESSLHFAYIDGRHDYWGALEDLRIWYKLVRPGGVLCGHDYNAKTQSEVIDAVKAFGKETGLSYRHQEEDFWFDKPETDK